MRLLLIQGDLVGVYEGNKRLAIFAGASQFDRETAEQLRLASRQEIESTPVENPNEPSEVHPN